MTGMRIVLDTNVFIACIGKASPFRWIFDAIIDGRFTLCLSNEILLEYHEILSTRTTPEIAENIANFLTVYPYVAHTDIYYSWQIISEDPDDNKFVDCMIASNAICIVSNDRHFRPYRNFDFPPLKVLTTAEFEATFKE